MAAEVHRGHKITRLKKVKNMFAMEPPDLHCTIRTKIEAKAVFFTSMAECSRHYRVNKKTRILFSTVLEVEIRPKATTSGRCRNFVVAKFNHGG